MYSTRTHPRRRMAVAVLFAVVIAASLAPPAHAQRRPQAAPYAAFKQTDTVYWLADVPFTTTVLLGPRAARVACPGMKLSAALDAQDRYVARIERPVEGITVLEARASSGGETAVDRLVLVVQQPTLRAQRVAVYGGAVASGIDAWRALEARVGEVYDPSTAFNMPNFPAYQFQTVVTINGAVVLNSPGLTFVNLNAELQLAMTITPEMRAGDIVTNVYWRPGGSWDEKTWVLLLSNQENSGARLPLEKRRMIVLNTTASEMPRE